MSPSLIHSLRFSLLVALAIGLAACIAGTETGPTPTISLQPQTGGPGTTIVVSGRTFPVGTAVAIRLGPPDVGASPLAYATATADSAGAFTTSFSVPAQWPDGNDIGEGQLLVIALNEDGSIKATAPFDFRHAPAPTLVLDPAEGTPGQRVEIRGRGFFPGQALTLHLLGPADGDSSRSQELAVVLGDEDGSFLTTITIPSEWPGGEPLREQLFFVTAHDSNGLPLTQARFFNLDGEEAGPFFHPPAPPLCAETQSSLTVLLAVPVVRSEGAVAYQDPLTGLTGESCRLVGEASAARFSDPDSLATALGDLFRVQGWKEDERYAQARPGFIRFAMEERDLLSLVHIEVRPLSDVDCADNQSPAECAATLPRHQVLYAVTVELVEGDDG